ncbi:hypothetical protein [Escherichia coli]|nr:hypothetical protein [Escherichia coli]HBD3567045.1 hypothetical protein [Escherichia coli]
MKRNDKILHYRGSN